MNVGFEEMRHLRRTVVKEELVELTGDHVKAIILNQFLYWTERTKDVDKYIAEEEHRLAQEGVQSSLPPTNGWIYKTSDEMVADSLLRISRQTMDRCLKDLVAMGYLQSRQNPDHRWDRTKQYRVDIIKIQEELNKLGYALEGYTLLKARNDAMLNLSNGMPNLSNRMLEMSFGTLNMSNRINEIEQAIPEITTKITTENNIVDDIKNGHHKNSTRENTKTPLNKTPKTEASFDPYSQMISRMSKHMGHDYVPSANDYRAVNQLLVSSVPAEFILHGIDFAFANSGTREINSFVYCAKIIVQNWALEMAKQSNVNPIDWGRLLGQSEHKGSSFETCQGKDWSLFEELFEERNTGPVNS